MQFSIQARLGTLAGFICQLAQHPTKTDKENSQGKNIYRTFKQQAQTHDSSIARVAGPTPSTQGRETPPACPPIAMRETSPDAESGFQLLD